MRKIIKGILIGIGAILPGLSGGMIAASLNVYKDLIDALNQFTKTPVKAVMQIWHYLLGILLGVLIGFLLIALIYTKMPIQTTFFFLGIILSTLPSYIKAVDIKSFEFKHYLTAILTSVIIISMLFLTSSAKNFDTNFLVMMVVGFLLAMSLIIPGLSGTMILMALGLYKPLVTMFKTIIDLDSTFDIKGLLPYTPMVIVLGLSGLLTLILLAKLLGYLLKSHERLFNVAILAIIISSPFTILYSLHLEDLTLLPSTPWYIYMISTILLIASFAGSYYLGKKEQHIKAAFKNL